MSGTVIGITTGRATNSQGRTNLRLPEDYVRALLRAGATPVLIPLGLSKPDLQALTERLDGILFSGGGDIHPSRYESQPHPMVDEVDEDRDRVEIEVARAAAREGKPFFGICRGLQVINVALGGSLYEDLLDQRPGSLRHQYYPERARDYLAHSVKVEPGSRLHEILAEPVVQVNSLHHQGVRRLASGLTPGAHAPDGLLESIELTGHPFGLAVQWHPECLPDDPAMHRLFKAFVEAAVNHRC